MTRQRQRKSIPKFASEAEEQEFWASHDSSAYLDWQSARPTVFPNLRPSSETISLRLPASLLADLKILANRLDVPYQSLLKVFLAERVERELRRDATPGALASLVREPEAPYGAAPPGTHRTAGRRTRRPRKPS
ncbi:MAG: BrnA antitoxin family protein [Thermoanaerobaculia bacterium]